MRARKRVNFEGVIMIDNIETLTPPEPQPRSFLSRLGAFLISPITELGKALGLIAQEDKEDFFLDNIDNYMKNLLRIPEGSDDIYAIQPYFYSSIEDTDRIRTSLPPSIGINFQTINTPNFIRNSLINLENTETNKAYVDDTIISKLRIIKVEGGFDNDEIERLRAFSPSYTPKFHKKSYCSISSSNICIYESFYITRLMKKNKISWVNNRKRCQIINNLLENEEDEIIKAVREGHVSRSLRLLTEKYNTYMYLYYMDREEPTIFLRGKVLKEPPVNDIREKYFVDMLYTDGHVAPYKHIDKENKKSGKQSNYKLTVLKPSKEQINFTICVFDIESYFEQINIKTVEKSFKGYDHKPFCLSYKIGENETETLYGVNCVKNFIKLVIKSLVHKTGKSKARPHKKVAKYRFFAHNGAGYDFLLLYKTLLEKHLGKPETIIAGNKIPFMSFGNVSFCDSSRLMRGTLRELCKIYNVKSPKTYYPYYFPNKDNICTYNGPIPEVKYWNSKEDRDNFIKDNPKNFNLQDVTIKYCEQDVNALYEIMKKYMSNCVGEYRGKKFNVTDCLTSSAAALKMFRQVGLKQDIYAAPLDIQDNARNAYYGGLTGNCIIKEVSDKNKKIYYYDINSSYPYVMTFAVPTSFKKKIEFNNTIKMKKFVNTNMYFVKVKFNSKNVIPNLPVRDKNSSLYQTTDQTDKFRWRWGIELNESVNTGVDIECISMILFESEPIFKDYILMKYNDRQEIKKRIKTLDENNPNISHLKVQSNIIKDNMNGLYGKFGQKKYKTNLFCDLWKLKSIIKKNFTNEVSFDYNEVINMYYVSYKDTSLNNSISIGNMVHIASYIASHARTNLSAFLRKVGFENVIYFDTDSCIFKYNKDPKNCSKLKDLIDLSELGKWKNETGEDYIKEVITLGPKMYGYKTNEGKETIHIKGINKDLPKYDDLKIISSGETKAYTIPELWERDTIKGITIKLNSERKIKLQLKKRKFKNDGTSEAIEHIPE